MYGEMIPGVRWNDPWCTVEGSLVYGRRIPGVRWKDPWCTMEGSLVYDDRTRFVWAANVGGVFLVDDRENKNVGFNKKRR